MAPNVIAEDAPAFFKVPPNSNSDANESLLSMGKKELEDFVTSAQLQDEEDDEIRNDTAATDPEHDDKEDRVYRGIPTRIIRSPHRTRLRSRVVPQHPIPPQTQTATGEGENNEEEEEEEEEEEKEEEEASPSLQAPRDEQYEDLVDLSYLDSSEDDREGYTAHSYEGDVGSNDLSSLSSAGESHDEEEEDEEEGLSGFNDHPSGCV